MNKETKYTTKNRGKFQTAAEFKALSEKVKKIPILLALVTLEPEVEIYANKDAKYPLSEKDIRGLYSGEKTGGYMRIPNGLCIRNPFRNDHNLGSCIIDRRKNTWADHNWPVAICNRTAIDFEERFFRFWDESWDEWPASEVLQLIKKRVSAEVIAKSIAKSSPNSPYATKAGVEKLKQDTYVAYKNGVYSMAHRFNLITDEEYQRFASKKPDAMPRIFSEYDDRRIEETAKEQSRTQPKAASAFVTHITLTALAAVRHSKLSKEQQRELRQVRMVQNTEDFFSFPRKGEGAQTCYELQMWVAEWFAQKAYNKKVYELTVDEKKNLSESKLVQLFQDEVENVPGFYRNEKKTLLISERANGGIGILHHDDKGLANGVQIRKADKDKGPKYSWLSSSWTLSLIDFRGGTSSGTPCGYLKNRIPKGTPKICITEGRYKAEKIADTLGDVIYISGVGTWENGGAIEMINRIKKGREDVYIVFDADLMSNTSVHGNLVNLARAVYENGLNPHMVIWAKEKGKGYDDLLASCGTLRYESYLKTLRFEEFEDAYQKIVKTIMQRANVETLAGQKKESVDKFNNTVQLCLESYFKLKKD